MSSMSTTYICYYDDRAVCDDDEEGKKERDESGKGESLPTLSIYLSIYLSSA